VLAAIDFNDQPRFVTYEVGDIPTDRRLSAEAESADLPGPQHPPDPLFGIGRLPPQCARSIAGAVAGVLLHVGWASSAVVTPTQPSPIKGEGSAQANLMAGPFRALPSMGEG
jgi:hypothetical protein